MELRGQHGPEAIMAGFEITVVVALFLAGVVTGLVLVVAWAVCREDHRHTLAVEAPDPVSGIARRMNGLRRRGPAAEFLRPTR
jgi:hypothetical protein